MNGKALHERITQLRARDPRVGITLNRERAAVTLLRGDLAPPVKAAELKQSPYDHARRFIRENKMLLGDIDEAKELGNERVVTDRRGKTHVVFYQKHGTARVLGAVVSVHYGPEGSVYLVKSNLAYSIDLPKTPKIPAERAAKIATEHAGKHAVFFEDMKPALVVADAKTLRQEKVGQRYYLCWKLGIVSPPDSRDPDWIYFVDALRGEVLMRYSAVQTGTGTGNYSQGTALESEASGATYRLRDAVTSSSWDETTKPIICTFDDNGSTSRTLTNYSEDGDDNWDDVGPPRPPARVDDQGPEVDLHRFLGYVLDYYYLTHELNSWDHQGADAKVHAHNEYYPNNAYWSSLYQQLYFADGDGDPGDAGATRDFMCPLDVVAHEFTHGVNDGFNIVQIYQGETGALNEALADIFGALIALEHPADAPWPWHHGRQIPLDGSLGRILAHPSLDDGGAVQYDDTSNTTKLNSYPFCPDHYSIRYTGAGDNEGVHINGSIVTHALYLMINGGTHRLSNVTVTGIGVAPVEEMLYEVISTGLLTNTSDFADFRIALIAVCQTLYPENLDHLAAVKTAFHAVGIGPDLYIRDSLADQGEEPGTLSCMSPDIILRRELADAATLALIGDPDNASLGQEIGAGTDDHYVYFRLFNRGSVAGSGTFRLFISPASTFPSPATWHEVGHFDFPDIAAEALWVPTAAAENIMLPGTLINALGVGHYCFIGIIECDADPEPDRMLIDNTSQFHAFIRKSNNYAWRNCNIVEDVLPDASGAFAATAHAFQMNGFDRRYEPRELEIDTRDLPEGTRLVVWIPAIKLGGLKASQARVLPELIRVRKIAGVLEELAVPQTHIRAIPLRQLAKVDDVQEMTPTGKRARELREWRPLRVVPKTVVRLAGLTLGKDETMDVHFAVKFPKNTGTRHVTLAFRERTKDGAIGQMNYVFRIGKAGLRRAALPAKDESKAETKAR